MRPHHLVVVVVVVVAVQLVRNAWSRPAQAYASAPMLETLPSHFPDAAGTGEHEEWSKAPRSFQLLYSLS